MSEPHKLSALEKSLAVLEAAVLDGRFSNVVQATGLPPATAHRILGELVRLGWLFQDENRTYCPAARAYLFSESLGGTRQLAASAHAYLSHLTARTGLTTHLGVLDGDRVLYAAKVDAPKPYKMTSRVGGTVPLYATAVGKVLLASMPSDDVAASIGRTGLVRATERTITAADQLQSELEMVRLRGWALDDEENEDGLRCVAAPLAVGGDQVKAAISVTGLAHELGDDRLKSIAAIVRDTARSLSEALGGNGRG